MNKETLRKSVITDNTKERLLENNSIVKSELKGREVDIYIYLCELSNNMNIGYQFGLKRFNRLFINWEEKRSIEKCSVVPTATQISNACKEFYRSNGKEKGFFPLMKVNNDGSVIIEMTKYIDDFYTEKAPVKEEKESREKKLDSCSKKIKELKDILESLDESDKMEVLSMLEKSFDIKEQKESLKIKVA